MCFCTFPGKVLSSFLKGQEEIGWGEERRGGNHRWGEEWRGGNHRERNWSLWIGFLKRIRCVWFSRGHWPACVSVCVLGGSLERDWAMRGRELCSSVSWRRIRREKNRRQGDDTFFLWSWHFGFRIFAELEKLLHIPRLHLFPPECSPDTRNQAEWMGAEEYVDDERWVSYMLEWCMGGNIFWIRDTKLP